MRRRWRCRRSHALPSVRVSLARGEADDVSLAPPQTATQMPPDAQTDRSACSAFIDECRNKMPPTDKQVAFAENLAERAGIELPPNVCRRSARSGRAPENRAAYRTIHGAS